jgi:hypothetical protein
VLYLEAMGIDRVRWEIYRNRAGETVYQGEHAHASPEAAARELYVLAKNATLFLSMLIARQPDLCRQIAGTESDWPVLADLTNREWDRPIAATIANLKLGEEVKGLLQAARTVERNIVRCWATAIYQTLLRVRLDLKSALADPKRCAPRENLPQWAGKTLALPQFTKANAREWARLGEEMLREQEREFLNAPDLAAKKRSWTHRANKDSRSGKASLRAIQREAFEDIAKELKNLAPERDLWRGEW